MNKVQAVVFGRNYSSLLGMIRAAGSAGCDITVIKTVKSIPKKSLKNCLKGAPVESKSKYVKKYLYAVEPDRKALVSLLLKEFSDVKEKVILLPTDDYTSSTIDLFQEQLSKNFLFPNINNKAGEIVRLMDKNTQKGLAIEAGLNVAAGWIVDIKNGKYTLPDEIQYPCFTKPQISFLGNKRCMKRCNSEKELREVVDDVAKKADCPILVEQYVEIEEEYAALGISDGEDVFIPDMIRMVQSGNGAHRGVTLKGIISLMDQETEYMSCLKKFIKSTGFKGIFDIDLYSNSGKMYFNELNLRFGASGYAVTASGINLPAMFIENLLNGASLRKQLDSSKQMDIKQAVYVNEKVVLDDYINGFLSREQYDNIIDSADICFIKADYDPAPYKSFLKMERYGKIKNSIKGFMRVRKNGKKK